MPTQRPETTLLRRTVVARAGLLSLMAVLLAASTASAYTRGRVRIANNTVVTDQGTLLRGSDLHLWGGGNEPCQSLSTFTMMRGQRYNSARLSVIFDIRYQRNRDIDSKIPVIDQAVDFAEQAGMYIGIDYHDCSSYELSHMTDFWTKVAPRYKDRTHVLYELANEPVAWEPESYTAQNIIDQQNTYALMRRLAPNTHIILMSYATANDNMLSCTNRLSGIDWSNASVGYHPYHVGSASGIVSLKDKYPCINTEFIHPYPSGELDGLMVALNGDIWGWVKWQEENHQSWWTWYNGTRSASQIEPLIANATTRGYLWAPDNFTTPPVGAYLTVSPDSIYPGDSASLSWQVYQMTSASIDQGIGAVSLTGGSRYVKPTQNTTYTLTASGNGQTYTKSVTVYIKQRRVPENPTGAIAGLDYKYYGGTWTTLPNFASLTPVKTGTVPSFDISVATDADNFGIQFNGYIDIPANGTYMFSTASDDGSRLYIGTTLVANNDGGHGVTEASGTIGLQAGKHAIRVEYFEAAGNQSLAVTMNGQAIAPSSLFHSSGSVVALPPARATVTAAREPVCYNIFGQRVKHRASAGAGVLLTVQNAGKGQAARVAVVGSSR